MPKLKGVPPIHLPAAVGQNAYAVALSATWSPVLNRTRLALNESPRSDWQSWARRHGSLVVVVVALAAFCLSAPLEAARITLPLVLAPVGYLALSWSLHQALKSALNRKTPWRPGRFVRFTYRVSAAAAVPLALAVLSLVVRNAVG